MVGTRSKGGEILGRRGKRRWGAGFPTWWEPGVKGGESLGGGGREGGEQDSQHGGNQESRNGSPWEAG